MERRRTLGSEAAEMGKEWKILLDKTVEDNSITQYLINAQGCTNLWCTQICRQMHQADSTTNLDGKRETR